MGQAKILEKLNREMKRDINEECQIIHILSLMVDVLEERELKSDYPYILFYRNWTMHNKLSRLNTAKLLLDIFQTEIDFRNSGHENARSLIKINSRFFKFETLKGEFVSFLKMHNLTLDLLNKNWLSFRKLLLEIIIERPVEFRSEVLKKMELIKNEKGEYCYKFSLVGRRDKPIVKLKFK